MKKLFAAVAVCGGLALAQTALATDTTTYTLNYYNSPERISTISVEHASKGVDPQIDTAHSILQFKLPEQTSYIKVKTMSFGKEICEVDANGKDTDWSVQDLSDTDDCQLVYTGVHTYLLKVTKKWS